MQEFSSDGAWNVSLCAQFAGWLSKWPKWPDQGTTEWTRGLQTERSFSMIRIFGKARKLSVCHKLVKCYGNLQDKFQRTNLLLR